MYKQERLLTFGRTRLRNTLIPDSSDDFIKIWCTNTRTDISRLAHITSLIIVYLYK